MHSPTYEPAKPFDAPTPERTRFASSSKHVVPPPSQPQRRFLSSMEMNQVVRDHLAGYLVTDTSIIEHARKLILEMYNLPPTMTYFPGALPVSLMRKDLSYITEMPYMVAEKTDGVRYLLLAFKDDKHSYSLLVDRGFRFYFTFVKFTTSLLIGLGTLFDGEIILEETGFKFYAHDLVCVAGNQRVALQTYQQRMYHVKQILRWQCFPADNPAQDLILMLPKQVFPISDLTKLWNELIPELPHRCDGLIFTPNNLPHEGKKNKLLFKWKQPGDNTVDLQLGPYNPADGSYSLLTWDTSQYFEFCNITMSMDQWQSIGISNPNNHLGSILECKFYFERNMWIPEHVRKDKIVPNDVTTIRKTIEAMVENLTIHELLNISQHAKAFRSGVKPYNPEDYYDP